MEEKKSRSKIFNLPGMDAGKVKLSTHVHESESERSVSEPEDTDLLP